MYLVDELSQSTIAYQTEMNAINQSCVFALLPIEFDPGRFFLLPLCNFSQGGTLAQRPSFQPAGTKLFVPLVAMI